MFHGKIPATQRKRRPFISAAVLTAKLTANGVLRHGFPETRYTNTLTVFSCIARGQLYGLIKVGLIIRWLLVRIHQGPPKLKRVQLGLVVAGVERSIFGWCAVLPYHNHVSETRFFLTCCRGTVLRHV